MEAISGLLKGTVDTKSRIEASVLCYDESPLTPCGIVGAYDGTIVCFNLESCIELWRINIGSMIKSKATSLNGIVYIAAYDGKIRCIDVMVCYIFIIYSQKTYICFLCNAQLLMMTASVIKQSRSSSPSPLIGEVPVSIGM